jgi:hypothetical protein
MPTTSIGVRSRAKPFIGLPKICAPGAAIGEEDRQKADAN